MVTLLHLADAHLSGRFYVADEALLKRSRTAERTALRRAVDCAVQEKVDAVLIAGGLFEDRFLDYDTETLIAEQFARLDEAAIPCFYAPGRPDPGGARFRGAEVHWPSSLHRFAGPAPEAVTLRSEEGRPLARIVGAGHAGPEAEAPRAAAFPRPNGGEVPHVGVLPAPLPRPQKDRPQKETSGAKASSRRTFQRALKSAGYAYWALGGAPRGPLVEETAGEDSAWYAGPLVARGPARHGPQGGLLVRLEAGELEVGEAPPQVAFRSFAPLRWADVTLGDLEATNTQHALIQQAQRAFENAAGEEEDRADWLARFTLTGGCPLASELREEEGRRRLEDALEDHLDLEAAFVRARHLTPPVDPARHRDEPHVLSEALALLDHAAADPARLRELAPDTLASGATDDDLRALTEALDREACARLLRDA
jgi:hypothetical protein